MARSNMIISRLNMIIARLNVKCNINIIIYPCHILVNLFCYPYFNCLYLYTWLLLISLHLVITYISTFGYCLYLHIWLSYNSASIHYLYLYI